MSGVGGARWEGTEALDILLARARRRLGSSVDLEGSFSVSGSDLDKTRRLIMGFRTVGPLTKSTTVPLRAFDEWLARPANGGRGLREVLGPVENRRAARAEIDAYVERTRAELRPLVGDAPWFPEWWAYLNRGTLTRHRGTPHVLNAARVLGRLPTSATTLTELVERATGNTKALNKTPARVLALRALSMWFDAPFADDAASARRLWERAGVVVDSMSSRVLLLGVRARQEHVVGRWLTEAANAGIPFMLNVHQLERFEVSIEGDEIFVCENPAVLEAAARELGPACAPLLCTEGQPSVAVHVLLDNFDGHLHWRGDFDWTGLRTTNEAVRRYAALPWRMDEATYSRGLARGTSEPFKERDTEAPSPWAPDLAAAMTSSGRAVMEERLIDELLSDLRRPL